MSPSPLASLAAQVARRCIERGATLAVAESCTGGLLGAALTSASGASAFFVGGVIAYANAEKVRALGVEAGLISRHGAVSREVAEAMASGCRARLGVSHALSVTGIAGPGGGTADKPVGTVWIALASPTGVTARRLALTGLDRDDVRAASVQAALAMTMEALG
jgi:PncC family amidohydrolase